MEKDTPAKAAVAEDSGGTGGGLLESLLGGWSVGSQRGDVAGYLPAC